jgi:polar amino acid transport system ATP-binding protein
MGPSGSGKTSILRSIAGLDPVTAGTITVGRVGMVFQFHNLFEHLTALQNVCLAPIHVLKQPRGAAVERARDLLAALGIAHRGSSWPHELSGGEAQRVAIARALAVDPPVLLLDEPTASLDPVRRDELAATLRDLAAQGRTILIATHDDDFVRVCAHRVLVIDGGRLVREGCPGDVVP